MSDTTISILIWGGAALTCLGLGLLIWCILRVAKAKRAAASDEELHAALQAIVPTNLAALCLSAMGLIIVIVGLVLS